jgi:hypothetical protein
VLHGRLTGPLLNFLLVQLLLYLCQKQDDQVAEPLPQAFKSYLYGKRNRYCSSETTFLLWTIQNLSTLYLFYLEDGDGKFPPESLVPTLPNNMVTTSQKPIICTITPFIQ